MIAAMMSATHSGQPSGAWTIEPRRKRLTPAMSSCAIANEIALTRWASVPNRRT